MGMTVKTPNTTVSNKAFGWDTYTYTVTRDEHSAPVGAVWTSLMIFRSTVIHSYLQCSHNKGAFSYISISCDNALVLYEMVYWSMWQSKPRVDQYFTGLTVSMCAWSTDKKITMTQCHFANFDTWPVIYAIQYVHSFKVHVVLYEA